jgi:hypothetical protein
LGILQIGTLVNRKMLWFGQNGFLGTRATALLDFIVIAMAIVVPLMWWSIRQAGHAKKYPLHRNLQITLALVLLVVIAFFEAEMRIYGWRERATASPYYASGWVDKSLWIHLAFAVGTPFLWGAVIIAALKKFPHPLAPGSHSRAHVFWGRLAAIGMTFTAVTGWVFYYLAFTA